MVAVGGKKGKNSWISFVMKIKKEENLPSLKAAMQRASERKSEWKRGGGDDLNDVAAEAEVIEVSESPVEVMEEDEYVGGRKRARTARKSRAKGRSARRGRARTARRGRGRSQKRA